MNVGHLVGRVMMEVRMRTIMQVMRRVSGYIKTKILKPVSKPARQRARPRILSQREPYFQMDNVSVFNDDVLATKCVDSGSVDLIVTSPPYNVDIRYGNFDDTIPYEPYLEFTEQWLSKRYQLAKDDGRFCLNIPLGKNKGGQQSVYTDIVAIAKAVGWKYHSSIVWNEQNI